MSSDFTKLVKEVHRLRTACDMAADLLRPEGGHGSLLYVVSRAALERGLSLSAMRQAIAAMEALRDRDHWVESNDPLVEEAHNALIQLKSVLASVEGKDRTS